MELKMQDEEFNRIDSRPFEMVKSFIKSKLFPRLVAVVLQLQLPGL